MGTENIKSNYYQSEIDRIDGDITTYYQIILDAQERQRAAIELREFLVSKLGSDKRRPLKQFHELSVRAAVRRALLDSAIGLRPKEIVDYMVAKDYKFPGSTNHNTRVSNELKNLMDTDLVTKKDGLYYAVGGGAT